MTPRAWAATDVGRKREHNEDSLLVDFGLALFAVADGMGGHQGGDHASKLACEILRRETAAQHDIEAAVRDVLRADPMAAILPRAWGGQEIGGRGAPRVMRWGGARATDVAFDDEPYEDVAEMATDPSLLVAPPAAATLLRAAARPAVRAIFDAAQDDARLAGMGTTLTALRIHAGRAHLVHVGDSRAFLIRAGRITQLTEDHSWIAEQVRAGIISESEARESRFRHIITRSVGFEREVDVDVLGTALVDKDCFLLCSDGMSNHVTPDEMAGAVADTAHEQVPERLVDLANERGGDDNITVVLVEVGAG
jgi:protein phosphatase